MKIVYDGSIEDLALEVFELLKFCYTEHGKTPKRTIGLTASGRVDYDFIGGLPPIIVVPLCEVDGRWSHSKSDEITDSIIYALRKSISEVLASCSHDVYLKFK